MRTVECNKVNCMYNLCSLVIDIYFVDFLIIAILETLLICCDTIFVEVAAMRFAQGGKEGCCL